MPKRKPNILYLLNDHQAYYRRGWDGGVLPARPNFERLAQDGIEFLRAYSACPLCAPVRRSMATGLYPHNHGQITNSDVVPAQEHSLIFPLLAEQGYQMYYYGKWHAGAGTAHDYGCEGFSYPKYGNPYITPEYHEYVAARGMDVATFDLEHVFYENKHPGFQPGLGHRCEWPHNWEHVTGVLETPDDTHESFFFANLACETLRTLAQRDDDQPFFLRVDFYGPHMPYLTGRKYAEMYDPEQIEEYGNFRDDLSDKPDVYWTEFNIPFSQDGKLIIPSVLPWHEWQRILRYCYGHITMVDAAGGMILDELERLGLAEDTFVVWTTDHGDSIASHGGHFDKNAYLTEEVLRIPMAIRWPGHIAPGQSTDALISNLDLPDTLLNIAGTEVPWTTDGRNLFNLVDDGILYEDEWRDDFVSETFGHHGEKVVGRSVITERYKYNIYRYLDQTESQDELYDLVADPYELHNLANQTAYQSIVAEMKQRLVDWQARTGDVSVL